MNRQKLQKLSKSRVRVQNRYSDLRVGNPPACQDILRLLLAAAGGVVFLAEPVSLRLVGSAFMVRLPSYLVFVPEYADTDGFSIFTHSWTVGVELKFYLLFPPAVFLMTKNANWRFAATAIAAALFTARGSFIAEAYCAVLFGTMLALALERPRGYAFVAKLTRVPAVVPLAAIAGLFALLYYSEQFTALAAVATYLLAYSIVQEAAVSRILTWRPLAYLGQRAYGAYLLHFLALRIGYMVFGDDSATAGLLAACVCLALTVPAAELLYRTIERPGTNYGRQLLSPTRSSSVP